MRKQKESVQPVEIRTVVDMARAKTASDIATLFGRMYAAKIPAFVVPRAVVQDLEHPFDDIMRIGEGYPTDEDLTIGTPAGSEDIMHTDRPWLIPMGTRTRLHQIITDHTAQVRVGRLQGVRRGTPPGVRYLPGASLADIHIDPLHQAVVASGDVTVFELSGTVAHEFSAPASGEAKRLSRIRSLGRLPTSVSRG